MRVLTALIEWSVLCKIKHYQGQKVKHNFVCYTSLVYCKDLFHEKKINLYYLISANSEERFFSIKSVLIIYFHMQQCCFYFIFY